MKNENLKQQLRKQKKEYRKQLTATYCQIHAERICTKLVQLSIYRKARSILFYMSIQKEVDMKQAIEQAWRDKKQVLLPRVDQENQCLQVIQVKHWSQLETGAYGIQEPHQSLKRMDPSQIDLVIVPGVAFDVKGYRLGYGGGYYDRFFARFPRLQRMGVAYPEQVVPTVYPEPHDQRLHFLLTSEKCYSYEKRDWTK